MRCWCAAAARCCWWIVDSRSKKQLHAWPRLLRKFPVPVWLTHGTYHGLRDQRFNDVHLFHAHQSFTIGDIQIDPFPTPHDAAESCQFVLQQQRVRFACVTDLGTSTPHVLDKLRGVNGLVVECNYDPVMLREGPYPASLQARIRSDYGHLGNDQAAQLVAQLDHPALQCILLGHLSEQNNSDQAALDAVVGKLAQAQGRVTVLHQHCCSEWHSVTDTTLAAESVSASPEELEVVD